MQPTNHVRERNVQVIIILKITYVGRSTVNYNTIAYGYKVVNNSFGGRSLYVTMLYDARKYVSVVNKQL